jgi:hypothetical protein
MSTFSRNTHPGGEGFDPGYRVLELKIKELESQILQLQAALAGYPNNIPSIGVNGNANIRGNETVTGTLNVTGKTTLGELQVNSKATLPGAVFDAATNSVAIKKDITFEDGAVFEEDVQFKKDVDIAGTLRAATFAPNSIIADDVTARNFVKTNTVTSYAPTGINLVRYGGLPTIVLYHLETVVPADLQETTIADLFFYARTVGELPKQSPINTELGAAPILTGMKAIVIDPHTFYTSAVTNFQPYWRASVDASGAVQWTHLTDVLTVPAPGTTYAGLGIHVHYARPLLEGNANAWMHEVIVGWRPYAIGGAKVLAGDEQAMLELHSVARPEVHIPDGKYDPAHVAYYEELIALEQNVIVKLADYYTKVESDALYATLQNLADTNALFGDYYNKTDIDAIKENLEARDVQSDWDQTDTTALDFIKNKPDIDTLNLLKVGMAVAWFWDEVNPPDGWLRCDGAAIPAGTEWDGLRAILAATSYGTDLPVADTMIIKGK